MAKAEPPPCCRQIVKLLADYLDGSLDPSTARSLQAHLDGCPPCIAFVNTYRGTVKAARVLPEADIPSELKDRLVSFLRQHKVR